MFGFPDERSEALPTVGRGIRPGHPGPNEGGVLTHRAGGRRDRLEETFEELSSLGAVGRRPSGPAIVPEPRAPALSNRGGPAS